jgi:hypothetical protein
VRYVATSKARTTENAALLLLAACLLERVYRVVASTGSVRHNILLSCIVLGSLFHIIPLYNLIQFRTILYSSVGLSVTPSFWLYSTSQLNKFVHPLNHCFSFCSAIYLGSLIPRVTVFSIFILSQYWLVIKYVKWNDKTIIRMSGHCSILLTGVWHILV